MSSLPKYRKHSTGAAFVEIAGKRHYLGPHGTAVSKREYDRLIAEWLVSGRSVPKQGTSITVTELIAAWLKHAKQHYRRVDGTHTNTDETFKPALLVLRRLYGNTPVDEFGPLALEVIRDHFVRAGAARTSCNRNASNVRQVFEWGCSKQLVRAETIVALKTVKGLLPGRTVAVEREPVGPVHDGDADQALPFLTSVVPRWPDFRD